MGKSAICCSMILSVLLLNSSFAYAYLDFDSGGTEFLGESANIPVRVDYNVDNVPGTHLFINDLIYVSALGVYHHGQATITNGTTPLVSTFDNGHVDITGGTISFNIMAKGNSTVNVSGGHCASGIYVYDNSVITYVGSNFKVGGVAVSGYLDIDYLVSVGAMVAYAPTAGGQKYAGVLAGTLADGTALPYNSVIFIWHEVIDGVLQDGANYNFIPEPATMLLLGLGGLLLRRRK